MKEEKELLMEQLMTQMSSLRKKLLTLEWDRKHNQLHMGMNEKLDKMKNEYTDLEGQLDQLRGIVLNHS